MKKEETQITVRVSKTMRDQYKLACLRAGKRMYDPLLKAIEKIIKIGKKYV